MLVKVGRTRNLIKEANTRQAVRQEQTSYCVINILPFERTNECVAFHPKNTRVE
jgi:hypothetical protein